MLEHQAMKVNSKTEANVSCVIGFEWPDSIIASIRPEDISLSQARKRLRASFNMMTEKNFYICRKCKLSHTVLSQSLH
jgi:hypothetical protein